VTDTSAEHWRAVSRFGYGPAGLQADGVQGKAWALQQLQVATAASRAAPRMPAELASFDEPLPTLFEKFRREREMRSQGQDETRFSREVARKAAAWRLAACSRDDVENPLLARMTEFWFNHLNVFAGKGAVRPFAGHYVIHAIRPHALGRYEDLLLASARHPAMLFYLDQARSVAEGSPMRPGAAGSGGTARPWPQRKLRPRTDGASHAGRERRLHPGRRARAGAHPHRLDGGPAQRWRLPLCATPARRRHQDAAGSAVRECRRAGGRGRHSGCWPGIRRPRSASA
jgi:hypothetical protein